MSQRISGTRPRRMPVKSNWQLQKDVKKIQKRNKALSRYSAIDISSAIDNAGSRAIIDVSNQPDFTRYLHLLCHITQHASATNTAVRLIIFAIDQRATGNVPAITDLLKNVAVDAPYDVMNTGHSKFMKISTSLKHRIRVKKDFLFNLHAGQTSVTINKFLPMHDLRKSVVDADSPAYSNVLCYMLLSNEATNTPTVNMNIQFVGYNSYGT